ncbi:MAG: putative CoA-binding protein [Candidatus Azotimanducaceae bacterium]|jgi:predicted CoA-binding protein
MSPFKEIFEHTKTIAIVGLSANPERASYGVAQALMPYFTIIPVNPAYDEVLGLTCYPDLQSVPDQIDMVNVFQRSENVMPFVTPSIDLNVKYFWMQLGIANTDARSQLEAVGIQVVEDRCTKIEFARFG